MNYPQYHVVLDLEHLEELTFILEEAKHKAFEELFDGKRWSARQKVINTIDKQVETSLTMAKNDRKILQDAKNKR